MKASTNGRSAKQASTATATTTTSDEHLSLLATAACVGAAACFDQQVERFDLFQQRCHLSLAMLLLLPLLMPLHLSSLPLSHHTRDCSLMPHPSFFSLLLSLIIQASNYGNSLATTTMKSNTNIHLHHTN